jgi:tetratricopeptide (TPR) repeat protein
MDSPEGGEPFSTDAARAADESHAASDWRGLAGARLRLGQAAREAGDLAGAEEHSRSALSLYLMLEDGYAAGQALVSLAQIRYLMGDYAAAVDLSLQAAGRLPGDTMALTGLGYAEWRAGSPSDAEATFSQALRWDSTAAPALAGRGQVRAELGKYASALDDLDRALSQPLEQDLEADARSARALALAGLGQAEEAGTELAASLRIDPTQPRSRLRAGRIAALAGRWNEARAEIGRALNGRPALSDTERDTAARLLARLNGTLPARLAGSAASRVTVQAVSPCRRCHRAGLSTLTSARTPLASSRKRTSVRLGREIACQSLGTVPQQILGIRLFVSGQLIAAGQMFACSICPARGKEIHPSGRREARSLTSASNR